MKLTVFAVLGFVSFSLGQKSGKNDKGILFNRRPTIQQGSLCWTGGSGSHIYDMVGEDDKGRKFLLAAGAAIGGAALGYHLGMKKPQQSQQPIINNNIYNELPPCVFYQSGSGGGGGILGGGGLLGNHPILSTLLQGGATLLTQQDWIGGAGNFISSSSGLFNRGNNVNWNRTIKQFNRVVSRLFRR